MLTRTHRLISVVLAVFVAGVAACDDNPTSPTSGALVTFRVGEETFRVHLETETQIEAAHAAQAGGPVRIPNGRIVNGTSINTGWNWHLQDVEFAAVTIELCDGRPSDVERAGVGFGGGRFCPWSAEIVNIVEL